VNNAGIMRFASIADSGGDMVEETFKINTFAPILMTRLILPRCAAAAGSDHQHGVPLGIRPAKGSSVYCASKAASSWPPRQWPWKPRRNISGST
jgi:short-subunit dehydrogenase